MNPSAVFSERCARRIIIGCCRLLFLSVLVLPLPAAAAELETVSTAPQVGDCVMFREGGVGLIFRTPTYWLKGTIAALSPERRLAGRCPVIGKPVSAYGREDWVRVAAAMPCVEHDSDMRDVDVLRIRVAVEEWETPWSKQHGSAGWLFRGQFLDQVLKKGGIIDMDATWLERCEAQS